MIGTNSIVFNFRIKNNKNPQSPYKVQLQANKNYGLCDVILPGNPIQPERTYLNLEKEKRKQAKLLYNEKKAEYDKEMLKRNSIRNTILNKFQGRQLNDNIVLERIENVLSYLLNTIEL